MQDWTHYSYKFAEKLTELYDMACKYYPIYEEMKSMSKAIAMAKWMYNKNVKIDLHIINNIFQKQCL